MQLIRLTLPSGEFYFDTMSSNITSVHGYTCAQIYGNTFSYIKAYQMDRNKKHNLGDTLSLIIRDTGVTHKLHNENAPEMVGRKTPFLKHVRKKGTNLTSIEPNHPGENYSENFVGKEKIGSGKIMVREQVPVQLWCYALQYYCDLSNMIVTGMFINKGRTGYKIILGNNLDISEYVEFEFYEYCLYRDSTQGFPHENKHLGRWIKFAHIVIQAMVYYVIRNNMKVIDIRTVSHLYHLDYDVYETMVRLKQWDNTIKGRIGYHINAISEENIQTPDMGKGNIISKHEL